MDNYYLRISELRSKQNIYLYLNPVTIYHIFMILEDYEYKVITNLFDLRGQFNKQQSGKEFL
jgi:hypothetical protein